MVECDHSLIADIAVLAAGKVLLVKYKDIDKYDGESGWFLPDDALQHFEHPEQAAKRILKQQLGLSVGKVTLGFIESFKGDNGGWHMSFHYKADLERASDKAGSADLAASEWFPMDRLPERTEVAHHGWALTTIRELTKPKE